MFLSSLQSPSDFQPIVLKEENPFPVIPSSGQQRVGKRTEPEWTREENWALWRATNKVGLKAWDQIAQQLNQRSPESCKERYFQLLNLPRTTKPLKWTKEEDCELLDIVKRYFSPQQIDSLSDWQDLAISFYESRRWYKDCQKRYSKLTFNAQAWTNADESSLIEAVASSEGEGKWKRVARMLGNKFSIQECQIKYESFRLSMPWTAKEDDLLLEGLDAFGGDWDKWVRISQKIFKGSRSAHSCATRFNSAIFQRKYLANPIWDREEEERLCEAVVNFRDDWAKIANHVKTRLAEQCQAHFEVMQEREIEIFAKELEDIIEAG
jgi:hypothetical protein